MKNKWLCTIYVILAVAAAVGLGYGIANGQEGTPAAPDTGDGFTFEGKVARISLFSGAGAP